MKSIQKNTTMTLSQKYFLSALALFILPISGVSIDIYVPSLPAVTHYFNTDKSLAQLTITVYMMGLGIMQLFAGGISDSFGRKKPFLFAMLVYILTTVCIPFVGSIYQLLFLRFIQGIAVGATVVPMRSVVSDLFEGEALYKMMTYMTMAWSIGPIIAPAIGGYLQHYFGWQMNFYFLTGYSLIAFILILIYMPETSEHRHPFHLTSILKRYYEIFFHKEYLRGLIINGALYSLIIIFAIVGPFLIQTVLHYSAIQFGRIALLTGLAWFLGAMTNRILFRIPPDVKTVVCFWLMFFISIGALILVVSTPLNIYVFVPPIIILLYVGGIVFPNNFALAISLFPKTTGSANALFGAFLFLITGLNSSLATFLKSTNEIPLMITYVGIISFCLAVYYIARK